MTKAQKLVALQKLKSELITADICSDLKLQATQLVFGSGNPDAEVVFIGEAPGKQEDLTGEPFVGASGKLLDELLQSINMQREQVYITSIVKYRPPNNRDPTELEKAAMWPYLAKQIEIIQPKLVVTLGRHSGQVFIEDLHISADHGKSRVVKLPAHNGVENRQHAEMMHSVREERKRASEVQGNDEKHTKPYENTVMGASQSLTQQFTVNHDSANSLAVRQGEMTFIVLPLYHPAAALYNGSLRTTLFEDFVTVAKIINSTEN